MKPETIRLQEWTDIMYSSDSGIMTSLLMNKYRQLDNTDEKNIAGRRQ